MEVDFEGNVWVQVMNATAGNNRLIRINGTGTISATVKNINTGTNVGTGALQVLDGNTMRLYSTQNSANPVTTALSFNPRTDAITQVAASIGNAGINCNALNDFSAGYPAKIAGALVYVPKTNSTWCQASIGTLGSINTNITMIASPSTECYNTMSLASIPNLFFDGARAYSNSATELREFSNFLGGNVVGGNASFSTIGTGQTVIPV